MDRTAQDSEKTTHPDGPETPSAKPRIIAIGASAGGLEPIEDFVSGLGDASGMAYVIIQHLSPDFRSMMPELLQRRSSMRIRVIEDGVRVEADTIYLNPPRSTLKLDGDQLRLTVHDAAHEGLMPINSFFRSLAETRGLDAVGVILSGTGTDGAAGAQAIGKAGGAVLAQDPQTAKFEGMPRAAIDSIDGVIVLPPDELPKRVLDIGAGRAAPPASSLALAEPPSLPETLILSLLQQRFGLDFGYYKTSTVNRRINRRAQLARKPNLTQYAAMLEKNDDELEMLYADLLIGVTAFFRDAEGFEALQTHCIAPLAGKIQAGQEVRVWVPGCATGEEAYSIAILLSEEARKADVKLRAKILATDIHARSLQTASYGAFPIESFAMMPEDLRKRYFVENSGWLRITPELREHLVFSEHNLIGDPPFTRMDIVSCRNLLIYLREPAQHKCIALFHFALSKGGALFLGPSETLGPFADEFEPLDHRWRLFRKRREQLLPQSTRLLPILSDALRTTGSLTEGQRTSREPGALQRSPEPPDPRLELLDWYDAVLSRVVQSSILVSQSGEILHVFSDAGRFLQVNEGAFSQKLEDLVEDEMRTAVKTGLEHARREPTDFRRNIYINGDDSEAKRSVTLKMSLIKPKSDAVAPRILVQISEDDRNNTIAAAPSSDELAGEDMLLKRIEELEFALAQSEASLHSTTQELETTNEELQSTNEELQAANEELMSSNEELQMVNEELHAVNEELYSVSAEHRAKIEEIRSTSADLDALLRSTDIGVLFLDADLRIRRITPALSQLFNIVEQDIGRPVGHITARFEYRDLEAALEEVIRSRAVSERNIEVEGRAFLLRILPYYRLDQVGGVVMTFVDITDIARANKSLTQFADIVSHDLKAPLRAISASSQWIVEDLADSASEEVRGHCARLEEHTERLSTMLDDLREFSNLGRKTSEGEIIDVSELATEVVGGFNPTDVQMTIEGTLPSIRAPRAALRLVFQNLIDNAIKHGGVQPVRIAISAEDKGDRLQFAIADNGKGIDPRFHAKIFEPFRKLLPTSKSPGTGIGLALVHKIVYESGGSIAIRSDPAQEPGTTFLVDWPKHLADDSGTDATPAASSGPNAPKS